VEDLTGPVKMCVVDTGTSGDETVGLVGFHEENNSSGELVDCNSVENICHQNTRWSSQYFEKQCQVQ
jgi:hypothetical protein